MSLPPLLTRLSTYRAPLLLAGLLIGSALAPDARAQHIPFDPSWYNPSAAYVRIAVVEDGVHAFSGQDLALAGVPVAGIVPSQLRLFENGREIPVWSTGDDKARLEAGDLVYFVGKKNRGTDEAWAYQDLPENQSSTFESLYTDTTSYWLTWGGAPGLRYALWEAPGPIPGQPDLRTLRDTVHLEQDTYYFFGDSDDATNTFYTRGEGRYWRALVHSSAEPVEFNTNQALPLLAPTEHDTLYVTVRLNSESASRHRVTLQLRLTNGGTTEFQTVDEKDWQGYAFQTLRAAIPQSLVPANRRLDVRVTSHNEFNANPNRVLVDWVELSYVRTLSATDGAQRFHVPLRDQANVGLDGYGGTVLHVFNPARQQRFSLPVDAAGQASFSHPAQAATYWAVQPTAARKPAGFSLDTPSDLANPTNEADYVIITTRALLPSAEALAAYRQSRGLATRIVDVQDVFDQFDYGRQTPIALRRFVRQMLTWRTPPRFLMLWGDAPFVAGGTRSPYPPAWGVPSYGYAPSDGWFAMQTQGPQDWSEAVAIGRISARTNEEGFLFLEKLRAYETAPLGGWEKRMMLLAGGANASEQALLQSHTVRWGETAAAAPAGMDTLHFFKRAFEPLDPSFQDSLRLALRQGLGWVNYFGHSASQTWEIVTDPPSAYNNADRLPFVVSLGCATGMFSGDRFLDTNLPSFGEQLTIGTRNGAIAHWGSSGLSSISIAARLNDALIRAVFVDTIRVAGEAIRLAKARSLGPNPDPSSVVNALQYGLLGDPATRLNLPSEPDLHVAQEDLLVTPAAPVPADSQMTVTVRLHNRGLVPRDSLDVTVTHTPPGQPPVAFTRRIAPFPLRTHVAFPLAINQQSVGENTITVRVDPQNEYAEADEANNTTSITQVVFSTGLTAVTPSAFGITNESRPRLRVSLSSPSDLGTPVHFQLDSLETFSSPALQTHVTVLQSFAAEWIPPQPLEAGRTYYWRTRLDAPGEPENWRSGAFTVLPDFNETGWLQQGNLFNQNVHNPYLAYENGLWSFSTYRVEARVAAATSRAFLSGFTINGTTYEARGQGFGMLTLDGQTGALRMVNSYTLYESTDGDPDAARAAFDQAIEALQPDDYLLVKTRHLARTGGPEIPDDIKAVFRRLGSTAIDTLDYEDMWVMMTRVGHPEETREWAFRPTQDIRQLVRDTTFSFFFPEGQTTSPLIGPAQRWHALGGVVGLTNAQSRITVDVMTPDGDSVLVRSEDLRSERSLAGLDAARYPYVRLRATLQDTSQASTPQLRRWYVTYDAVPELAFDPSSLVLSADTLAEGAPLTVRATVHNLSTSPAERALVQFLVTDAENHTRLIAQDTLYALAPDSARAVETTFSTAGYPGRGGLTLRLLQPGLPEPITFNNVLLSTFFVRSDREPPRFQVLLEGRTYPSDPKPPGNLQDPLFPFVSVRPTIEVQIQDDSANLLLTDTSVVRLSLDGVPVFLTDPTVRFEPATADNPKARVVFTPDLSGKDTTHTFRVVVTDASGNQAEPYQVHFRTQSAAEVQNLYPYPNPMAAATTFAFELRGADPSLLDDFRLRIYSISGRVVREFDLLDNPSLLDSGALRIGWNKLRWDTRDEDGDLLASGVYLYKIFLRAEGAALEVNNASSVEKLVILR